MPRPHPLIPLLLCVGLPSVVAAAEGESYARVAEELRAANEARSRRGAEVQAWREESERLAAATDGLQAELARAQTELAAAEALRDGLRGEHQRLGAGEVASAQVVLVEAAVATRTRLQTLAAGLPPGAITVPADDALETVLKALDASFKLAGAVGVEVAAGHLVGDPPERRTAIRVLRAGPLAWWLALDGRSGGTTQMVASSLELTPVDEVGVERIQRALAMAEGRQASEPIALPRPPAGEQQAASPAAVSSVPVDSAVAPAPVSGPAPVSESTVSESTVSESTVPPAPAAGGTP